MKRTLGIQRRSCEKRALKARGERRKKNKGPTKVDRAASQVAGEVAPLHAQAPYGKSESRRGVAISATKRNLPKGKQDRLERGEWGFKGRRGEEND